MKIHIRIPFALNKDLGRAYNEEFENVPAGDWVCLLDYDILLLTPGTIRQLYKYVETHPTAGLFTCYAHRTANRHQIYPGNLANEMQVYKHIKVAREMEKGSVSVNELKEPISGFLMLVSKAWWERVKFPEGDGCLGVDNEFSRRIMAAGGKVLRMNTVFVWHTYRLLEGVHYKSHLL